MRVYAKMRSTKAQHQKSQTTGHPLQALSLNPDYGIKSKLKHGVSSTGKATSPRLANLRTVGNSSSSPGYIRGKVMRLSSCASDCFSLLGYLTSGFVPGSSSDPNHYFLAFAIRLHVLTCAVWEWQLQSDQSMSEDRVRYQERYMLTAGPYS